MGQGGWMCGLWTFPEGNRTDGSTGVLGVSYMWAIQPGDSRAGRPDAGELAGWLQSKRVSSRGKGVVEHLGGHGESGVWKVRFLVLTCCVNCLGKMTEGRVANRKQLYSASGHFLTRSRTSRLQSQFCSAVF